MVESLDHRFVMDMDVGDRQSDIISYTSIHYNEGIGHRGGINGEGI